MPSNHSRNTNASSLTTLAQTLGCRIPLVRTVIVDLEAYVTTGGATCYRFVRHPIYSGLLAAVLGTALVTNLIGLIIVAILIGYFYYSASVEEKNLTATFPTAYPAYRAKTKMLIPYLL
jgi:protein-S-isoprenylcysteine O-methyltransferase Ste14